MGFANGDYTTLQGINDMLKDFPGVQGIAISQDPSEKDAQSFVKKIGTAMPELYIPKLEISYAIAFDNKKTVKNKFLDVTGMTTIGASATFIIDGTGTIVWREQFAQGYFPPKKGQLAEQLRRIIAGEEL